jgi:hypothetical protein
MPALIWWSATAIAAGLVAAIGIVLYFELRNQHHIWHDACITPQDTQDDMRQVLAAIGAIMEGSGIRWWLDYGTLLGAWRLGRAMAFDHDLDLSFLDEDEEKLRACMPDLEARGIVLNLERTSLFFRGRKIGDWEKWSRYGDRLCRDDPARRSGVMKFWRPLVDDIPAAWIEPLWHIRMDGRFHPCPNRPERLLRKRYLTCRLHLRLAIPHKQKCWKSRAFWQESGRIWRFRDAPRYRHEQTADPS